MNIPLCKFMILKAKKRGAQIEVFHYWQTRSLALKFNLFVLARMPGMYELIGTEALLSSADSLHTSSGKNNGLQDDVK